MLVDCYPSEDVFARVPELAEQTDLVLMHLDPLLDDYLLYQQVRADLAWRFRLTLVHGRHSTPAEELLRLLVVQHLYAWSYAETVARVADSLVLRWSCAGSAACTSSACPPRRRCCAGRRPSSRQPCRPSAAGRKLEPMIK